MAAERERSPVRSRDGIYFFFFAHYLSSSLETFFLKKYYMYGATADWKRYITHLQSMAVPEPTGFVETSSVANDRRFSSGRQISDIPSMSL